MVGRPTRATVVELPQRKLAVDAVLHVERQLLVKWRDWDVPAVV